MHYLKRTLKDPKKYFWKMNKICIKWNIFGKIGVSAKGLLKRLLRMKNIIPSVFLIISSCNILSFNCHFKVSHGSISNRVSFNINYYFLKYTQNWSAVAMNVIHHFLYARHLDRTYFHKKTNQLRSKNSYWLKFC